MTAPADLVCVEIYCPPFSNSSDFWSNWLVHEFNSLIGLAVCECVMDSSADLIKLCDRFLTKFYSTIFPLMPF